MQKIHKNLEANEKVSRAENFINLFFLNTQLDDESLHFAEPIIVQTKRSKIRFPDFHISTQQKRVEEEEK